MADDLYVIATPLQCLAILFNTLFSVHILVLSVSIELLEQERYITLNNNRNNVNALLTAASLLFESFCKLLFMITICPQAKIPRVRIEGVVFPNFCTFSV